MGHTSTLLRLRLVAPIVGPSTGWDERDSQSTRSRRSHMNQGYGQAVSQPYMQQGDYPVQVLFPLLDRYNRFYAIPLVGYAVKWIMLIPYLIAMAAIGLSSTCSSLSPGFPCSLP